MQTFGVLKCVKSTAGSRVAHGMRMVVVSMCVGSDYTRATRLETWRCDAKLVKELYKSSSLMSSL